MKAISAAALLACLLAVVNAHSYHFGACPVVEPMQGFDMSKFLGYWYVIEKTSTGSKCIGYNYTRGDEPGEYVITQDSNHLVLGLTPLKHQYHYTGVLNVPDPSTPANMIVRFPLSIAGDAKYVVFSTDYKTYAGIFSCQEVAFAHRQSTTLLSRFKELDVTSLKKLHGKMESNGINRYGLSIVSQKGCDVGEDPVDIDVNPDTFSKQNIRKVLNKAGEKISEGAKWVANAGTSVYHKVLGHDDPSAAPAAPESKSNNPTIEPRLPALEVQPSTVAFQPSRVGSLVPSHDNIEDNEVEWIP